MLPYRLSPDVAASAGVSKILALQWAKRNGVQFVGSGMGKMYLWTDGDVERFKNRDTRRGRIKREPPAVSPDTNELVTFPLDRQLLARIPGDPAAFINAAIREKLDGGRSLAAAAAILGTARSERKAASSRLNGFAPCGPGKRRGRPKKRDVPADRGRGEDGS